MVGDKSILLHFFLYVIQNLCKVFFAVSLHMNCRTHELFDMNMNSENQHIDNKQERDEMENNETAEKPTVPYVEDRDIDGCVVPLTMIVVVPYAALYPLFWVPFAFTKIGFPVYSLYVWPVCLFAWLASLIVARKYLNERDFFRFLVLASVFSVLIQTVLTFWLSYPDL